MSLQHLYDFFSEGANEKAKEKHQGGTEMEELKLMEGTAEERERYIGRVEVLERVKELNTLAGTEYMTTNQVANFYEVEIAAIRQVLARNGEELRRDGVERLTGNEVKGFIDTRAMLSQVSKVQGGIMIDGTKVAYSENNLYPKRAILRIGMLLRDSPVAKEVRTLLLNVYHDVEQGKEDIVENINKDYDKEAELQKELAESFMSGDLENFSMAAVKVTNLLNKRINELQPKADYTDKVLKAENLLTTTQIAKDYGMSARALNGILHGLGIQHKQSGQWFLYSEYQNEGYTKSETYLLEDGRAVETTKWTQKGKKFINDTLEEEGITRRV